MARWIDSKGVRYSQFRLIDTGTGQPVLISK
jgi:hypothetical protein